MKTIRAGILGCGNMGGTHARNLLRLPQVEIVALCAATKEATEKLNLSVCGRKAQTYADFDKMVEEVRMDVLFVCLPPFAHAEQIEKAAGKGIHIFTEKPLALTLERARSMVAAVEKAGVLSHVGYHMRYGSEVMRLKKMIQDGTAGSPTLFQARYFCNSLHTPWWIDRNKCGGQVLEQVIHLYDLALHLMGEPETISGFAANLCHQNTPGYTVEDTSAAIIRFRSGGLASIVGSNCAVPQKWTSDFRVVCGKATANFASANDAEFFPTAAEPVVRNAYKSETDCYFEEVRNFVGAVRGEADMQIVSLRQGMNGLQTVLAVLASSNSNGTPQSIHFQPVMGLTVAMGV